MGSAGMKRRGNFLIYEGVFEKVKEILRKKRK
jgi:hypothetical protein